jgi:hypothetical protein
MSSPARRAQRRGKGIQQDENREKEERRKQAVKQNNALRT